LRKARATKSESLKLDLRRGQRTEGMNFLLGMTVFITPIPPLAIFAPTVVPAV
jgi:hypothetical protein